MFAKDQAQKIHKMLHLNSKGFKSIGVRERMDFQSAEAKARGEEKRKKIQFLHRLS